MEFQTLNLNEDLKKALLETGYLDATDIQQQVLEPGLGGRDIYAQSQTGTGKTAAYLIVIMQRLLSDDSLKGKKALVMVPTRELAVQVEEEARLLAKYLPLKIASFYGGVGYGAQEGALRGGVDILIGTPGRVLDLNAQGKLILVDCAFLVLDEADRMFDMGFFPDLRRLLKVLPESEKRQTMLFSATLNVYVKNLALEYTKTPVEIEIEPEHITVEEIEQVLYHVPSEKKFPLLLGIMRREAPESAIIFCNTKRWAEIIARKLRQNGIKCEFITGDIIQKKRLEIIEGLKSGRYKYLAATDLAARGLDVENLSMVINYDLPIEAENYVHRIGRTARAGAKGVAVSFASERDVYELAGIERYINDKIPAKVACDEDYVEEERGGYGRGRRGRDEGECGYERGERVSRDNRGRDGRGEHGERGERGRGRGRQVKEPRPSLSKMSEEERLDYYKKKYDSPSPVKNIASVTPRLKELPIEPAQGALDSPNAPNGGQKNNKKRRKGQKSRREGGDFRGAGAKGGSGDYRKGGAGGGNAGRGRGRGAERKGGGGKTSGGERGTGGGAPGAKKGILSRILSLFGKKSGGADKAGKPDKPKKPDKPDKS